MSNNGTPPTLIHSEWDRYRADVEPTDPDEAKLAFYGGAWVVLRTVLEISQDHITQEQAEAVLTKMMAECKEFRASLG